MGKIPRRRGERWIGEFSYLNCRCYNLKKIIFILLCLISIGSAAPTTPTIAGPASGASGTALSFSTTASEQLKYTFAWGDGTSANSGWLDSGTPTSASHTYTVAAGTSKTFQALVTVDDGSQFTTSASYPVTITGPTISNTPPATPSIPSGSMTGVSGVNYRYTTKASDTDSDKVKYTFDWGDGSSSTTALVNSGTSANALHIWTIAPGSSKTFNVAAKATDEHGASSMWSNPQPVTMIAAAANHPPTIPSRPNGPTAGAKGVSYSYSTSSTDPDGNSIKYTFDWGNGASETAYIPSGQLVTMSHTWSDVPSGQTWTYKVRVLASDSKYEWSADWSESLVVAIKG